MPKWLFSIGSSRIGAQAHIIFFPHAGGSAAMFSPIATALPSWLRASAMEYPGHGRRLNEPLLNEISDLAHGAAASCRAAMNLPLVFFGHSMGSLVAFEVCRILAHEVPEQPKCLIVSAHRSPQIAPRPPLVTQMSDEDLIAEVRDFAGMPAELLDNQEIRTLLIAMLRVDGRACENYMRSHLRTSLNLPVVAYGGSEDASVLNDELLAWHQMTKSSYLQREFPGKHFYFNESISNFAFTLATDIAQALNLSN
jgi:surfactin synthase thioesterase subunit